MKWEDGDVRWGVFHILGSKIIMQKREQQRNPTQNGEQQRILVAQIGYIHR